MYHVQKTDKVLFTILSQKTCWNAFQLRDENRKKGELKKKRKYDKNVDKKVWKGKRRQKCGSLTWQVGPEQPGWQEQVKLLMPSTQRPEFKHGFTRHSSMLFSQFRPEIRNQFRKWSKQNKYIFEETLGSHSKEAILILISFYDCFDLVSPLCNYCDIYVSYVYIYHIECRCNCTECNLNVMAVNCKNVSVNVKRYNMIPVSP